MLLDLTGASRIEEYQYLQDSPDIPSANTGFPIPVLASYVACLLLAICFGERVSSRHAEKSFQQLFNELSLFKDEERHELRIGAFNHANISSFHPERVAILVSA